VSNGAETSGAFPLGEVEKWGSIVDTCFQKGIMEEGIWVKLESRLKGYPCRPKIAPTNLQFLVFGRGEDYGMKYALLKETMVLLFHSLITRRAEFHEACPWVNENTPAGRQAQLERF